MSAPPDPDRAQAVRRHEKGRRHGFRVPEADRRLVRRRERAPQLSFRGSTQAYSDTQLAIWVRNPEGRILESVTKNPAMALIYGSFDPTARAFMIFRGRARIDSTEAVRRHVYERAHAFEREQGQRPQGKCMVIDLDSVEGFFGGAQLKMRR